CQQRDNTPLSF
nr:immunoglobulin light chain junction region [Macaca mulatta]MOV93304.1 immunoglobulin light chain junction region [Macaca mulatta]MOV94161.1 immunoglobulin light chain junction region [Macaca mulatta]MOV94165.1 immunoglobulin light chain junction region [Macaca mulatta]